MIRLRPLFTVALVATAIAALHFAGRFVPAPPTGLSATELSAWADPPADALAAVLRWLALALGYYLLVVGVLGLFMGERLATHRLSRFAPPMIVALFGIGVTATSIAAPSGPDPLSLPLRLPAESALTLDAADSPLGAAASEGPSARLSPSSDIQTTAVAGDHVWVVSPGESFWSIAHETLVDVWGTTELDDAEVSAYWRPLIEANRDRLVDPSNPDLIHPGQELVLPEPPPRR